MERSICELECYDATACKGWFLGGSQYLQWHVNVSMETMGALVRPSFLKERPERAVNDQRGGTDRSLPKNM